jgi:hypothetical protein
MERIGYSCMDSNELSPDFVIRLGVDIEGTADRAIKL